MELENSVKRDLMLEKMKENARKASKLAKGGYDKSLRIEVEERKEKSK